MIFYENDKIFKPENVIFNDEKCTLVIPVKNDLVDLNGLAAVAKQKGLVPKADFHITVIGFNVGKKILSMAQKSSINIVMRLEKLISQTDWSFSFRPGKFHVKKDYDITNSQTGKKEIQHRETLIQMVTLPSIDEFYNALNEILDSDFLPPPPHVTLFVNDKQSDGKSIPGIGIDSWEEFETLDPKKI